MGSLTVSPDPQNDGGQADPTSIPVKIIVGPYYSAFLPSIRD
jgi:hypothetical protein